MYLTKPVLMADEIDKFMIKDKDKQWLLTKVVLFSELVEETIFET